MIGLMTLAQIACSPFMPILIKALRLMCRENEVEPEQVLAVMRKNNQCSLELAIAIVATDLSLERYYKPAHEHAPLHVTSGDSKGFSLN